MADGTVGANARRCWMLRRAELPLAAAFFLSGAAGLVYQVAWQRILALHSGVGIYSVAIIVASFMAGLGVGSLVGGALSLRTAPVQALRAFGLLELAVGLFGVSSCGLYYDLLYRHGAWLYGTTWSAALLHFAGLLLPTGLMGMTLPFLVRAFVSEAESAGRRVGLLYGLNVLGASAGAFVTPWLLIRFWGIRGAVAAAAAANLIAGATALLLSWLRPPSGVPAMETTPLSLSSARASLLALLVRKRRAGPAAGGTAPAAGGTPAPLLLWSFLYAWSGFSALSLEILWFRTLDVAVKASAFAFGTLLALYLLGLAAGCLVVSLHARPFARPLRAFLLCQSLLLLWSGLSVIALGRLPADAPGYETLLDYWGRGHGFVLGRDADPLTLALYGAFPLLLFGLPTLLMGLSFPALQQAVQGDPRQSGRRVGLLQAANIGGCVLGSLLLGLAGLTWLGTTGSLRVLLITGLVFPFLGWRRYGPRLFGPLALALVAATVLLPSQGQFWSRLHGRIADPDLLVDEDASGVVVLARRDASWLVYVDGKEHSWVPFGGEHSTLGALPAIIHEEPRRVAVIGLGSGDTAWAAGCRGETRALVVYEIAAPQPRLLRRLASERGLPDLQGFLDDPRLEIVVADGRNAVARTTEPFDVIEADALWPHVAYSGNLYSLEFFRNCAARLGSGGVMCTWAPTPRIAATFRRAFPYVLGTPDHSVLVGSRQPLPLALDAWTARLDSERVATYLGRPLRRRVARVLRQLQPLHEADVRLVGVAPDRDLFPRDEFLTP